MLYQGQLILEVELWIETSTILTSVLNNWNVIFEGLYVEVNWNSDHIACLGFILSFCLGRPTW